jgi:3-dehydroquinate synthase
MKKVRVRLTDISYEIHIGAGILGQVGCQLKENGFVSRVVIITNPIVKELYGDALEQRLAKEGFKVTSLQVPDGEEYKSLEIAGRLYQGLSAAYAERSTPVLALGGGVIGDLAGFVAATYQRGVPLVHLPTTLLAQVDSSIGGKVAVDHGQIKNKIGVFYQPRLVIADVSTLKTLPQREFASGMAEVIKSAVIGGEDFFRYIEENLEKIKSLDEAALEEIVFRSARIKVSIVEKDEKDLGLRNVLNYGHTLGHAIESASDFRIKHGEAVAIGILAAARISNKMGIFDRDGIVRLESIIARAGLPTKMPPLEMEKIIQAMKHDKKIREGKLRFVLPRAIGNVFVTDEVNLSLVEEVLGEMRETA